MQGPATVRLAVGETADIVFTPGPGEYLLGVKPPGPQPVVYARTIIAR